MYKRFFGKHLLRPWRKRHAPNLAARLPVTILCLLLLAKLIDINILFPRFDHRHAKKIQNIFLEKERRLHHHADILRQCACGVSCDPCLVRFHEAHAEELKRDGLYVFMYQNDSLIYWSAKDVAVPESYLPSELDRAYASLGNGRYASFVRRQGDYVIVGLVLIKSIYTYENKYLQTSFQEGFGLPANVKIFSESVPDSYPISDSRGRFMWSLIFDSTCSYRWQVYVPALIYLLAIFIFFIWMDSIFRVLRGSASRNLCLPVLALLLFGAYYLMQHWNVPSMFYRLEIFSPDHFGSAWFASLGQLGLWCMFFGFFVFEVYRYLRFPLSYKRRWKYFAYTGISLVAVVTVFFAVSLLIRTLVINSSGLFEGPNRTLLLNWFSLLGYVLIMSVLSSFCLLFDKLLLLCKQEINLLQFLVLYAVALSLVTTIWSAAGLHISLLSILFLSTIAYIGGIIRLKKFVKLGYYHFVLLVFVLSLFTSLMINRYSSLKYEDQKKVIVTNLASMYDPTAEFLFRDITDRIVADTTDLADQAFEDLHSRDYPNVLNYVKRQFFYNYYWNRYVIRCWVCTDTSKLFINDKQRNENYVGYFRSIIEEKGSKISRSEFWFIDRPVDAYYYYLGWFRKEKEGTPPLHIFIELWQWEASEEVGYPELLLDGPTGKANNLKGYSYAKYRNNKRVTEYGDYKYNLQGDVFQPDTNDYHTVNFDGMEHLVYHPDDGNLIVLSTWLPKLGDLIINFSYIFIFFFLVVSVCLLIFYLPVVRRGFQWNFRNKIQYSMIAIILVSFAIIGVGTVLYINRQYRDKNNDIINEKMQAIHSELLDVLLVQKQKSRGDEWKQDTEYLVHRLSQLRRIFFTDINIFDVNGRLIETSLPDVFVKGLVGRQINPNAYIKLAFGQRASILEREAIGGLRYISAYEPFVDKENRVIAFLNLPYFTQQDALAEEIYSVVMAVTNFYMVIILLTVIVSIVMSNQITQPLIMLQEKFRNIKLGEKNDPVHYEGRDEVGGLVKEYNRAIGELAQSASRLARSERESAWREMARQIAHEINNPLTPMKLSIQHLKRAYDNRSERFGDYMEKISRSLVEQIDTLSSIATEFSNFAKMPAAHNERFDVIAKINNTVPLFAVDNNKRAFHVNFHGLEKAVICADREQISRVFVNLLKNALQAIPKDRQAEIHIDILKLNKIVWIRIKDNGTGIPDEMQEKIFLPNFTTKSSGMGMGLAIVRNIIESAGGTISFKTRHNEGTTFIIGLPSAE